MDEFLKSITCSGSDCYSWILVLFNILAVFYLVFCSFWKVTRAAKITGWVWSAGLLCATVGILIAHTCIYTLLTTIFTAMMIMAILSVILPQPNASASEEKEEKSEKLGAYVISKTDDGRFAFAIYDAAKKLIVRSKYSYKSVETAKNAVCVCRDSGMMAAINDKTGAWIKEENYPTFEMYAKNGKYYFCLKINGKYVIFDSNGYNDVKSCERMLEKAKKMVASTSVFLNTDTVRGKEYEHYDEQPVAVIEEISAEEKPVEEGGVQVVVDEKPNGEVVVEIFVDEDTIEDVEVEEVAELEDDVAEEVAATEDVTAESDNSAETVNLDDSAAEDVVEENDLSQDGAENGVVGSVVFTADRKTLWDKYAELTAEQRRYFDRIRDYANGKENVRCVEAKDYLTFKFGREKLVRLRIRKDMVEAVFMLVSSTFKTAFSEGEIKVKEAATIIRVENDAYLDVAIKTIDMEYDALVEEKRLRKEEQKEKRRQARKAAREANSETVESTETE